MSAGAPGNDTAPQAAPPPQTDTPPPRPAPPPPTDTPPPHATAPPPTDTPPGAEPPPSPAAGVRARARADMRETILEAARRRLASEGAASLSLRAVARDVGLVSSAVYRYVENRDALLTALIIEAYDSLGRAVEAAEAPVERDDVLGRWLAIARAVRQWALTHPHEYSLVYGTPVPGYAAPQDTVGPATRVARLLVDLLTDAHRQGLSHGLPPPSDEIDRAMAPVRVIVPPDVPGALVLRGLGAQAHLFGAVSFELFGQRHHVVAEDLLAVFFDEEMRLVAEGMWITDVTGR